MAMNSTPDGSGSRLDDLLRREWLVTNHLGGYASSTVPGLNTRKYHGLLVAAMAPPVRRMVLLSRVEETVRCDGWPTPLACNEYPGTIHPEGHQSLHAFSPEPFPRWAYQGEGWSLEKSLQLLDGENAVVLTYTLLGAARPVELELRPLLALRSIHDLMYQWNGKLEAEERAKGHHRVPPTARTPEVFFAHDGKFASADVAAWYFNTIYRCEQDRGYAGLEDLWSPGVVKYVLSPGQSVHFVCSADPIDLGKAVAAAELQCAPADLPIIAPPIDRDTDLDVLTRAARQFVPHLPADAIAKTPAMVTRFPWSPPNVRDTLIALPGTLLVTGQYDVAKGILLGLASQVRNGTMPTEFYETGGEGYSGADTPLWFVNAVFHYHRYTKDEATLARLLPAVDQIVAAYELGAAADVEIDRDGLVATRAAGATWMDACTDGHYVTPRVGKPVELNALWYNALRIAAELSETFGSAVRARELRALAAKVYLAFNERFWNPVGHCCYDVVSDVGANDTSVRPNQLLAVSLPMPVLGIERHPAVLERVRLDLLTPLGPRTLSAYDGAYVNHYRGDVAARDRALHNGSVHPWLLGQFVSAYVRVMGRSAKVRAQVHNLLLPCIAYLREQGLGHLPELFDGDAPHRPGGAIASAMSVAELLRCYVEDVLDQSPAGKVAATVAPPPTVTLPATTPAVKH
jgi:predicted glycogen debranching enzyme